MAEKSVFVGKADYPYCEEVHVETDWFGGFAPSQKRKCELALHLNFQKAYPEQRVLEISGKSLSPLGAKLSAMSLSKRTLRGTTSVESAFQSSRVYRDGNRQIGPFPEWLFLPGRECRRAVKKAAEGLYSYQYDFDGQTFYAPDFHLSLFYDFLYLNALLEPENAETAQALLDGKYTAFTDLASKALNSQARSCAIFVSLAAQGRLAEVTSFESYLNLFRCTPDGHAVGRASYNNVQPLCGGKVHLLSPVVAKTVPRETVEGLYRKYYDHLTNKKQDSWKRPGVYDIALEAPLALDALYRRGVLCGYRATGQKGCLNIPLDLAQGLSEEAASGRIDLILCEGEWVSAEEAAQRRLWPTLNEQHTDILARIRSLCAAQS